MFPRIHRRTTDFWPLPRREITVNQHRTRSIWPAKEFGNLEENKQERKESDASIRSASNEQQDVQSRGRGGEGVGNDQKGRSGMERMEASELHRASGCKPDENRQNR